MSANPERMKVLEMVAAGTISSEEALQLLGALDWAPQETAFPEIAEPTSNFGLPRAPEGGFPPDAVEDGLPPVNPPEPEEIRRWKRWWVLPAGIGIFTAALGAWWMYAAWGGLWVLCAAMPLLMGLLLIALGWSSRKGLWLHLRVTQPPGEPLQRIIISIPIPVRITAWGLRLFGNRIPHTEGVDLGGLLLAMNDEAKHGTPLLVDADEGDGERVQVFIG